MKGLTFAEGQLVAVYDMDSGLCRNNPPARGVVQKVNKRCIEVLLRGRVCKFQPDGRGEYPRSQERFRARFPSLGEWTKEKAAARAMFVRRRSVEGFKYDKLTDEQISRVYDLLSELGMEKPE